MLISNKIHYFRNFGIQKYIKPRWKTNRKGRNLKKQKRLRKRSLFSIHLNLKYLRGHSSPAEKTALFHLDNQILTYAPECFGRGNM